MPDTLPIERRESLVERYGVSLALVVTATVLTPLIPPVAERATFMLLFLVLAFIASQYGLGPALASTLAGAIASAIWLIEPIGRLPSDSSEWLRLGGFVVTAVLISALGERSLRSQRRERAQREWSDVTLASVGDAVLVTDEDGRVRFLNRVAEELTGWSRDEAKGRFVHEVFDIVNETTREPVENPSARVRREGKVVGLANHTLLRSRSGRETPIDDSGAPIWSEDRRVVGTVLVFRDVSERRASERAREILLERAQAGHAEALQANRAKDEFLAVLSHELRTPLQAILGWAQVLQGGPIEREDLLRAGEAIERNARRQSRLVEDVLDVSRIVSGKLVLESERVPLERAIRAAVDMMRPSFDAKHVALAVHVDSACAVVGDEARLEQVIWNLLSNAAKFTPSGGRVTLRSWADGDDCLIAVEDTGCGVHASFLPRVFDRFRQEDATTTRHQGGLGLGLAIVRHIVELHGGSVEAASDGPGLGATFAIRLPRAAPAPAVEAAPGDPATERVDLSGVRVLVVDDDTDARELIARILRGSGAELRTAESAQGALAIATAWRPEVVLTDLEMPEVDGYELLRRLRSAGLGDVPAVALTAFASKEHAARALRDGFRMQASKPIGQDELLALIGQALSARGPSL